MGASRTVSKNIISGGGPGPSDYNVSYRGQLKNNPRITIGNGRKD